MMSSMRAATKKTQFDFRAEKYKSPAGILLNSRTVVEKKDFVSTGILSYAEGDIIEIEITDFTKFQLGDQVKLTVYSPGGVYVFDSTLVARHDGSLIVINPPSMQKHFAEKREHPRIQVMQDGRVRTLGGGNNEDHVPEAALVINNISLSGVGFTIKEEFPLIKTMHVELEMDLGMPISCTAEIMRKEPGENGVYYGARYVELLDQKANSLRAFVLKKQVENYFTLKKDEDFKRKFK